jgi:hypothetical protein
MKNVCDNCGNDYDKNFSVVMKGMEYEFDCFECAINKLAPVCAHCQTKVIGHGVEWAGSVYCCHHCLEAFEKQSDGVLQRPTGS